MSFGRGVTCGLWIPVLSVCYLCRRHLLNMTTGIHDMGGMQWPLIICLGVSWFTCFMCLFKGIKSMGKVCPLLMHASCTLDPHIRTFAKKFRLAHVQDEASAYDDVIG